jgi:hypothetical protein
MRDGGGDHAPSADGHRVQEFIGTRLEPVRPIRIGVLGLGLAHESGRHQVPDPDSVPFLRPNDAQRGAGGIGALGGEAGCALRRGSER